MTIIEKDGIRTQTASEGFYLKQGDLFVKVVDLGNDAEPWDEVPESELPQDNVMDVEAEIIQ